MESQYTRRSASTPLDFVFDLRFFDPRGAQGTGHSGAGAGTRDVTARLGKVARFDFVRGALLEEYPVRGFSHHAYLSRHVRSSVSPAATFVPMGEPTRLCPAAGLCYLVTMSPVNRSYRFAYFYYPLPVAVGGLT